jgi:hypothetical protein
MVFRRQRRHGSRAAVLPGPGLPAGGETTGARAQARLGTQAARCYLTIIFVLSSQE